MPDGTADARGVASASDSHSDDAAASVCHPPVAMSAEAVVGGADHPDPRRRQRVLPLTEFVAQLHVDGKLGPNQRTGTAKHDSKCSPIPVPLFRGETEEEYEEAFKQSLSASQQKLYDPLTQHMRKARFQFALSRAKWYGKEEGQAEFTGDPEGVRIEELSRELLCVIKYVWKKDYRMITRKKGFFEELKKLSTTEIYNRYDNAVPPIYMPVAFCETPQQCETRFEVWLRETKNMSLPELVERSPIDERNLRIEFAETTGMIHDKSKNPGLWKPCNPKRQNKEQQSSAVVSSGAQSSGSPPEFVVCVCPRCLVDDSDQAKSRTIEASCECHDQSTGDSDIVLQPSNSCNGDSVLTGSHLPQTVASIDDAVTTDADPYWLCRVQLLADYVAESHARLALKTEGNPTVESPSIAKLIPVLLFEGETKEEYERAFYESLTPASRFDFFQCSPSRPNTRIRSRLNEYARWRVRWYGKEPGQAEFFATPDNLDTICLKTLPRAVFYVLKYMAAGRYKKNFRIGFFSRLKKMSRAEIYNRCGNVLPPICMPLLEHETRDQCEERFGVWLRETKKTTLQVLESHENPLEERVFRIQFAAATARDAVKLNKRPRGLTIAMPNKKRKPGSETKRTSAPDATSSDSRAVEQTIDSIEAKLESEYEAINQNIVMNENVLEDLETQVAAAPVKDIQETSQLLHENEEFRRLIDEAIGHRDAALGLLIVCMWRDTMDELRGLVNDSSAMNVPQIHRAGYHKCARLSAEISETQTRLAHVESQLNAATTESTLTVEELTALRSSTTSTLQTLLGRRRNEFKRLIHFDERLRLCIQELLTRV